MKTVLRKTHSYLILLLALLLITGCGPARKNPVASAIETVFAIPKVVLSVPAAILTANPNKIKDTFDKNYNSITGQCTKNTNYNAPECVTIRQQQEVAQKQQEVARLKVVADEEEIIQKRVTFEVDNSFTQERIGKEADLINRTKEAIKEMKITIRSTMNNRPLNHDYKVKVKTYLLAEHNCTAKRKTSQRINGCNGTVQENREISTNEIILENREISTNEIILTRKNNWSSTFKIDSRVAVFAVKENWVAIYETELSKLEIKPKVISIEEIK